MSEQIKQHTRRIEFDNKYEFALFDARGLAVDSAETFPDLESAQYQADYLVSLGWSGPFTIMTRRTPQHWRPAKK